MKALQLSVLIIAAASLIGCKAQTGNEQQATLQGQDELQLYYFHFTKRCATCNTVENETRVTLDTFYADQVKSGNIVFTALNLEEEEGKKIAAELGVSGQTLMLVRGEKKVNLTNEGFLNARTKPDQFHDILKHNIDQLL